MAFHNNLTPFLGEDATEYAPEHETTTEFMNGKFQEVLDNDLWLKANTVKTYKSLADINPTFTIDTPVVDVIVTMEDNSMVIYETSISDAGVYPTIAGTIIITKQRNDRNYVQCSHPTDGVWYTSYHVHSNPTCSWKQLSVQTTKKLLTSDLQNGWVVSTDRTLYLEKVGNMVSMMGVINGGVESANTIMLNIPEEFRPTSKIYVMNVTKAAGNNQPIVQTMTIESNGNMMINELGSHEYIFFNCSWIIE